MALRIMAGLVVGGSAGLALNLFSTRVLGGGCALTCNPYAAMGLSALFGLMWSVGA